VLAANVDIVFILKLRRELSSLAARQSSAAVRDEKRLWLIIDKAMRRMPGRD
jgi:hypothetical protein